MTRTWTRCLLLVVVATAAGCLHDRCDPGQRYQRGLCYDIDAGVGSAAAPVDGSADAIVDAAPAVEPGPELTAGDHRQARGRASP